MSVIIEGLTLPKHNPKEIDKNVLIGYAIVKEDNTAELCLEGVRYLIKMLPTPHGRLIDCERATFPTAFRYNTNDYADGWNACIKAVQTAPTVIEAEVSENA